MLKSRGFTIVELVVVITVIGILAGITIFAYNGVQGNANDSAVQSDLKLASKQLTILQSRLGGVVPSHNDTALNDAEIKVTKGAYLQTGNNFLYCRSTDFSRYAIVAQSKSGKMFAENNGQVGLYTAFTSMTDYAGICTNLLGTNNPRYGFTTSESWRSWLN